MPLILAFLNIVSDFIVGSRNTLPNLPSFKKKEYISVVDAIDDLPVLRNGADTCVLEYRKKASSAYARKMRGQRTRCSNNLVSDNAEFVTSRYKHIPQGGTGPTSPAI